MVLKEGNRRSYREPLCVSPAGSDCERSVCSAADADQWGERGEGSGDPGETQHPSQRDRKNGIFTSRGTFLSCDPMVVPACPPRVSMRFPFTPLSLLSAYERCVSTEDQEKMLSSVKCGKLHRNLGPVLSRTVSQLYCTKGALS
ncbi:hypothetical protein FKM82_023279 [Ascaphus truei]